MTRDSLVRSVADHQRLRRRVADKFDAFVLGVLHELAALFAEQIGQAKFALRQLDAGLIQSRQIQHVADKPHQRIDAALEIVHDLRQIAGDGRAVRTALDQLGEQVDRVGGRADVVGDGGEKAALAVGFVLGHTALLVQLILHDLLLA